eukprot:UN30486
MNQLVLGCIIDKSKHSEDQVYSLNSLRSNLLLEYTNSIQWKLPLESDKLSIQLLKRHAVQVNLLLRGVAIITHENSELIKLNLMHIMYPILEHLGSGNTIVSSSALACIERLYKTLQYSNVDNFVIDNADYLIDSMVYQLNYGNEKEKEKCLNMLVSLLSLSESPKIILPLLKHTITSITERLYMISHNKETPKGIQD